MTGNRLLRIFVGNAASWGIGRDGALTWRRKGSKAKLEPLSRMLAFDEDAGRGWLALTDTEPDGTQMARFVDRAIERSGVSHLVVGAQVDTALRHAGWRRPDVYVEHPASGFAARIHLPKKLDEFLDALNFELRDLHEGMVTVEELTRLSEDGFFEFPLGQDLDRAHTEQYSAARALAVSICRGRGRDPEKGRQRHATDRRGPVNSAHKEAPIGDVLSREVVKLQREAPRLTEFGEFLLRSGQLLMRLRNAESAAEQAALRESLGTLLVMTECSKVRPSWFSGGVSWELCSLTGVGTADMVTAYEAATARLARPVRGEWFPRDRQWFGRPPASPRTFATGVWARVWTSGPDGSGRMIHLPSAHSLGRTLTDNILRKHGLVVRFSSELRGEAAYGWSGDLDPHFPVWSRVVHSIVGTIAGDTYDVSRRHWTDAGTGPCYLFVAIEGDSEDLVARMTPAWPSVSDALGDHLKTFAARHWRGADIQVEPHLIPLFEPFNISAARKPIPLPRTQTSP